MPLAGDVGFGGVSLGVQGVELLRQALFGRLSGVSSRR